MRKVLMYALIILLIAIFVLMLTSGISIGALKIVSISNIIKENENLDTSINNLNGLIENDYSSSKSKLDESYKKLQVSKKRYQDEIMYSTEEEIKAANQTEEYSIGFLWTKIGLYATKNNIIMKANVTTGNVQDKYNISFTITGEYIAISEFIRAIENDSSLGFKIEDFNLIPSGENDLQATFVIRNIAIDRNTISSVSNNFIDITRNDTNANEGGE